MAAHDDAFATATRLRTQLAAGVRQAFAGVAALAALAVRGDSTVGPVAVMRRSDVQALLGGAVAAAQQLTQSLVAQAWGAAQGPEESETLWQILEDVQRAYEEAPAAIRLAVASAYHDAPLPQRAEAVARAIREQADKLVLRGKLSVGMASSGSHTAAVLASGARVAEQGYQVSKRWNSRRTSRTCRWCLELDGLAIPLDAEFPHGAPLELPHARTRQVRTEAGSHRYRTAIGAPIIMTRPPSVYGGVLLGPPRHPRCECWIDLLVSGPGQPPPGTAPVPRPHVVLGPSHMLASDVAAMPDAQYRGMMAFLRAATHELGQLLRRVTGRG